MNNDSSSRSEDDDDPIAPPAPIGVGLGQDAPQSAPQMPLSAGPKIPGIRSQPVNETVSNLVSQISEEIKEINQITEATSNDSNEMYIRSRYIKEIIYQLTFKVKYLFAIYKVLIKTVIDLREQLEIALEKSSTSDASVGDDDVDDLDDDSDTRSSIGTSSLTESESPTEIVKKLTELRGQIVNIKGVLKKIQSQVKATAANLPDNSNTQSLLNSLKEMNKYLTLSPEQDIQAGEIDRAAQVFENKNIEDLKKLNTSSYSFNPNLTKPQKPLDDATDPNLKGVEGTATSLGPDGKPNNSPLDLLGNLIPDRFKGNGGKRKRKSRKRFRKTKGNKKVNTKKKSKKISKKIYKKRW